MGMASKMAYNVFGIKKKREKKKRKKRGTRIKGELNHVELNIWKMAR